MSLRGSKGSKCGSLDITQGHINRQIFHNRKSHDFDSHERGGAKVKGVEETVGVEADSVNSMG